MSYELHGIPSQRANNAELQLDFIMSEKCNFLAQARQDDMAHGDL